jgi:hypothetical protein
MPDVFEAMPFTASYFQRISVTPVAEGATQKPLA